jgi:hypothetical protein
MKKVIAIILTLCVTTSFAQHRHNHFNHYYGGYGGGGGWVAPLIIGGIAGAVIANANRPVIVDQQPVIVQQNPPIYQNPIFNTHQYYQCLVQVYDQSTNTYRNEAMTCVR